MSETKSGKNSDTAAKIFAGGETKERMREQEISFAILENISDPFYALDRDFCFTYINRRAERYYGIERERLIGRNVWEVFPMTVGTAFQENYEKALRENIPVEFEILSPFSHAWIEVRVYPSPEGLLVYFRDITTRKQAEEKLRESAAQIERQARVFETTLSSIVDFAYIFDKEGRFVYSNQPLLDLLGITLDEIVGKTFFDLP